MKHNGGRSLGRDGYSAGRTSRAAIAIAIVAGGFAAAPALAQKVKASIQATARLEYDNNPFLLGGSDVSSGSVSGGLTPKLSYTGEKDVVELTGYYDRTKYFRRYDDTDAYGGGLEARHRFAPGTEIYGGLRYDSSIIGANNDNAVTTPGTPPVDDTDVNLIGTRARSETYSASGGFNARLSSRDDISARGGITAVRYPGRPAGSDSTNYGGTLGYNHAISEKTRIGISGTAYYIDYDTPGLHTMVMQPSVTFSSQLSPSWNVEGSLGVSFSTLSAPGIPDSHDTSWAGTLDLCHKGQRNNLCLSFARSVSASGFGGTTNRTSAGLTFDQRLTERLNLTASGTYVRSESQQTTLGTREYVGGSVGLNYRLLRNLKIGAEARYRDLYGAAFPIDSDYGGTISATLDLPGGQ
jgi:hypothetical protein